MSKNVLRNLYPVECSRQVLGAILNDIELINSYKLEVSDFYSNNHKIIFASIQNMIKSGIVHIDDFVIKNYLEKNNEKWCEKYIKFNEDMNFIEQIKSESKINNFEYHFNRLKKFSLLRELHKSNIDISEIYDITDDNRELNKKFEEISENDIIDNFSKKILAIKDKRQIHSDSRESFKVGEGLRELKEKYKKEADFGYPIPNTVINYIVRGQRKGTVSLISGTSGSGKSRNLYNQAVYTASPFIFDIKNKEWVANGTKEKVLVISTELSKEEIQGIFLSVVSGVEQDKILENTYTTEEEERIDKAIEILEDTDLYCEYISDFNMKDIEIILEKYIINHNVDYLYFDYIHETPSLLMETSKMGNNLRADQSLFLFGAKLKELARVHNVYIASATQMNRTYKNNDSVSLDATAIRGAMSLSDKIDVGIILTVPTEKEKEEIKQILEVTAKNNFSDNEEPNIVYTIYKNRGGKLKGVRVWCYTNLGNMNEKVLCITDESLKPLKRKLEIRQIVVPNEADYEEKLKYLNN